MHPSKTCGETWARPKLYSILAEIVHPLHYRGLKATCHLPRVFKLNLTNFQAETNKQSGVFIVRVPFSLSKLHGLPLSHKLQCCGGTVMSNRIVKMTLMLHVWQKPNYPGLCSCQSLLIRETCWHVAKLLSLQWLALASFFSLRCVNSGARRVRKKPATQKHQVIHITVNLDQTRSFFVALKYTTYEF